MMKNDGMVRPSSGCSLTYLNRSSSVRMMRSSGSKGTAVLHSAVFTCPLVQRVAGPQMDNIGVFVIQQVHMIPTVLDNPNGVIRISVRNIQRTLRCLRDYYGV